jgi:hypothetical protein
MSMSDDDDEDIGNSNYNDSVQISSLDTPINIKYLNLNKRFVATENGKRVNYFELENETSTLRSHLINFHGFINVPTGTSDLRGMFNDLNGILSKELRVYNGYSCLAATTSTNCNNKGEQIPGIRQLARQERATIHSAYQNMCFYCGKKITSRSQCDHVIPIIQMFISLDRTNDLFYNFQKVHSQCNNKASKMNLGEIWEKIGTPYFPGPANATYPQFALSIGSSAGPNISSQHLVSADPQSWCRGYLAKYILEKLRFSSIDEQESRKIVMQRLINKYKEFKDIGNIYLSEVGQAAMIIQSLRRSRIDTPTTIRSRSRSRNFDFGKQKSIINFHKIIKSDNKDKKWTAYFEKNGKLMKTDFGARGMSDFTIHKDIERRERYITRHLKDLDTKDPTRPGYLSMYILWNKPSLQDSINDYKKRLLTFNKTGNFPLDIVGSRKLSFGVAPTIPITGTLFQRLPDEIMQDIQQRRSSDIINKNIRRFLKSREYIKSVLYKIGMNRYNQNPVKNKIYLDNPYLNLDILDDTGIKLLELSNEVLTKSDFKNKSFWWNLVNEGLEQIENIRHNGRLSRSQLSRFTRSEELIIYLIKKAGIYFDFSDMDEPGWINRLIIQWNELNNVNFGKVPDNVVDKKLYESIKKKIKDGIKGRRWGAYDSGRLVQDYKNAGGKYLNNGKKLLSRWYKEQWVDACAWPTIKPCGRKDMNNKMAYCRPMKRITKDTPETVSELSQKERNARCRMKKAYPMTIITKDLKTLL